MAFIKRILLRWVVRDMLKAVTVEDLLRMDGNRILIGKKELTQEEIILLREEAKRWENSLLWKLMLGNLYWIANFKMIKGANRERDMDGGRMFTLMIETIQEFIEKLKFIK